jgi:outer membrane receptor for ferrienterochelin and colicin
VKAVLTDIRLIGVFLVACVSMQSQSGGAISVLVRDASGISVGQAKLRLEREAGGWSAELETDAAGRARFVNLPWLRYVLHAEKAGFASVKAALAIRSAVPEEVVLDLPVAGLSESLTVVDQGGAASVDPEQTGSRATMSRESIEQLAQRGGARGLEQVLLSFPGFAQNANGTIHPRGAHNQMTFVIDGMPISDQLGGAFANAIDPSIVESVELYTGNIPAEYGNKVSAVAQVTTRTGAGSRRKLTGNLVSQAAQFDLLSQTAQFAGEAGKLAYSGMGLASKTNRFLDGVSLDNLHNGGNSQRAFLRTDYQLGPRDTLRFSVMGGRSGFESANLRSQQANGMRQRNALEDMAFSGAWMRVLDAKSALEINSSWRPTWAQLLPSAGDTPVTAQQERSLGTFHSGLRYSRLMGRHNVRVGGDVQRFVLRENFTFAVTEPGFDPDLIQFERRPFVFSERGRGALDSIFIQDQIRAGRFTLNLGLRYDSYRFLVNGAQWQPRVGVAYHLRETGTVFRISYNRLYQTPPNENLLLSNSDASAEVLSPGVRQTFGDRVTRLRPERQNFYEAGVQQSLGPWMSFQGTVYHKNAKDQQDNNNFFNTGIVFPITLAGIRVNGAEARWELKQWRGFSSSLSLTHSRAISTPPFTGGLYIGNGAIEALSAGPFVIDHDQKLGAHLVMNYRAQAGWFVNGAVRHDSGLVVNPSDPEEVAADPDYADLLPYVKLGVTPSRARPRTISDAVVGYRRSRDGSPRWEAALQVTNLTDQTAVYNFQSAFVGTRVVQPRTFGVRWRYWF